MRTAIPPSVTERRHFATVDPDEPTLGLVVVSSPDRSALGRLIDLARGPVVLGRGGRGAGRIDDSFMSRQHARVRSGATGVVVEDQGSSNGTAVNGVAVDGPAVLERGDIIRVGATFFVLDTEDEGDDLLLLDLGDDKRVPELVGQSLALKRLRRAVTMVAATEDPVLILGATGTGKEVTARAIHRLSGRAGTFVAVNCAAIPAELAEAELFGAKKGAFTGADEDRIGYFEQSNGGTLFLDELGELPAPLQAKLLRALEDGCIRPVGSSELVPIDLRVVAATNADLSDGRFRRDLLARLEDWVLRLQPIAHRRADIIPLFEHFAGVEGLGPRCTESFIESLLLHDWPLNARELRKVARRVLTIGRDDKWRSAMLPPQLRRRPTTTGVKKATPDRSTLLEAMRAHDGNVSKAAAHLGSHRRQLYRWLERHNITPQSFRVA